MTRRMRRSKIKMKSIEEVVKKVEEVVEETILEESKFIDESVSSRHKDLKELKIKYHLASAKNGTIIEVVINLNNPRIEFIKGSDELYNKLLDITTHSQFVLFP